MRHRTFRAKAVRAGQPDVRAAVGQSKQGKHGSSVEHGGIRQDGDVGHNPHNMLQEGGRESDKGDDAPVCVCRHH